MDISHIKEVLRRVQAGQTDIDSAMEKLKRLPYDNLSYARIDTHLLLSILMKFSGNQEDSIKKE